MYFSFRYSGAVVAHPLPQRVRVLVDLDAERVVVDLAVAHDRHGSCVLPARQAGGGQFGPTLKLHRVQIKEERRMTSTEYIQITHRELPYSTFDADNHLYENQDALTQVPAAGVRGRRQATSTSTAAPSWRSGTRSADYIPNPTFDRVAVPGGAGMRHHPGRRGLRPAPAPAPASGRWSRCPASTPSSTPSRASQLMKEMGIDRTLLWPTLASVLEERVADDPDVACRRDPRAQRVDARALDLRLLRRHLLHADHQPRRRQRRRHRGARVHPRARRARSS